MRDAYKRKRDNEATGESDESLRTVRYGLWENVPGALSSNNSADFRVVLEEFARVAEPGVSIPMPPKGKWKSAGAIIGNGWSLAWRIFDSQFWGVAQRRRRICLLADFDGYTAPDIVFEHIECGRSTFDTDRESLVRYIRSSTRFEVQSQPNCMSGNPKQGKPAWEKVATDVEGSTGASNSIAYGFDPEAGRDVGVAFLNETSKTLTNGTCPGYHNGVVVADTVSINGQGGSVEQIIDDQAGTLTAGLNSGNNKCAVAYTMQVRCGKEGGGKGALIQEDLSATLSTCNIQTLFQPTAYGICSYESNSMKSSNPDSGFYEADTSRTLDLNGGNPACNQGGIAVVEPMVTSPAYTVDMGGGKSSCGVHEESAPTLTTTHQGEPAVIYKGDGAVGGSSAFAIVGDHEDRPTDMTNLVVQAYRKQGHPRNAEEGQGWEEADKSDTLNIFDNGDTRTPTVVVSMDRCATNSGSGFSALCVEEDGIQPTLIAAGPGSVCYDQSTIKSYQDKCGALCADDYKGANGQYVDFDKVIVETIALEGNGQRPSHLGDGFAETDKSYTLNTTEVHGVCYPDLQDKTGSLMASGYDKLGT